MNSSRYHWLLSIGLLLGALFPFIACFPDVSTDSLPSVTQEKTTLAPVEGTVTDVVDSNVIKITASGTVHTVRYIGVYALVPYRHSKPLEYYFEECKKGIMNL